MGRHLLLVGPEGQVAHKGMMEEAGRNSGAVGWPEYQPEFDLENSGAGHTERAWSL